VEHRDSGTSGTPWNSIGTSWSRERNNQYQHGTFQDDKCGTISIQLEHPGPTKGTSWYTRNILEHDGTTANQLEHRPRTIQPKCKNPKHNQNIQENTNSENNTKRTSGIQWDKVGRRGEHWVPAPYTPIYLLKTVYFRVFSLYRALYTPYYRPFWRSDPLFSVSTDPISPLLPAPNPYRSPITGRLSPISAPRSPTKNMPIKSNKCFPWHLTLYCLICFVLGDLLFPLNHGNFTLSSKK